MHDPQLLMAMYFRNSLPLQRNAGAMSANPGFLAPIVDNNRFSMPSMGQTPRIPRSGVTSGGSLANMIPPQPAYPMLPAGGPPPQQMMPTRAAAYAPASLQNMQYTGPPQQMGPYGGMSGYPMIPQQMNGYSGVPPQSMNALYPPIIPQNYGQPYPPQNGGRPY
jgi:hypothetical protein